MCGRFVSSFRLSYSAEPSRPWRQPEHAASVERRTHSGRACRVSASRHRGTLPERAALEPGAALHQRPEGLQVADQRPSETIATSGMFRGALAARRCLVLADVFYQWKVMPDEKQPYAIARADSAPLAFAGLWEAGGIQPARCCGRSPSPPRRRTMTWPATRPHAGDPGPTTGPCWARKPVSPRATGPYPAWHRAALACLPGGEQRAEQWAGNAERSARCGAADTGRGLGRHQFGLPLADS